MELNSSDDGFLVHVEPYGKEVRGLPGETLLQALMRQFYGREGHPLFFGCRRGGCASCKMRLLFGDVDHSAVYSRAALPDDEKAQGYILACKSLLKTHVSIYMTSRLERLVMLRRKHVGNSTCREK
ncbi:2Fe-2S iron-sulfur cluster-binding protein [Alicyclobacillus shizuokensis]|uniref:2Fe-2S iron-sulfur cluster-binding protein n=1 Tax=Alicyclobacillus shizuokensis TaxID=392014 RepID=UPI0009F8F202|nr:2Fe-2S iron-sulfur cluster binding domain-containing protein [Alicyclobacillus shizuokensis]MCL6625355.1 2Fe-2S iron-sulfur cluster binding domain-containing protein [Alicyclobacillus shizuokensis]